MLSLLSLLLLIFSNQNNGIYAQAVQIIPIERMENAASFTELLDFLRKANIKPANTNEFPEFKDSLNSLSEFVREVSPGQVEGKVYLVLADDMNLNAKTFRFDSGETLLVVHSGLLFNLKNDDALAGVVGHEYAHHVSKISDYIKAIENNEHYSPIFLDGVVENEADMIALIKGIHKKGYNPYAFLDFIEEFIANYSLSGRSRMDTLAFLITGLRRKMGEELPDRGDHKTHYSDKMKAAFNKPEFREYQLRRIKALISGVSTLEQAKELYAVAKSGTKSLIKRTYIDDDNRSFYNIKHAYMVEIRRLATGILSRSEIMDLELQIHEKMEQDYELARIEAFRDYSVAGERTYEYLYAIETHEQMESIPHPHSYVNQFNEIVSSLKQLGEQLKKEEDANTKIGIRQEIYKKRRELKKTREGLAQILETYYEGLSIREVLENRKNDKAPDTNLKLKKIGKYFVQREERKKRYRRELLESLVAESNRTGNIPGLILNSDFPEDEVKEYANRLLEIQRRRFAEANTPKEKERAMVDMLRAIHQRDGGSLRATDIRGFCQLARESKNFDVFKSFVSQFQSMTSIDDYRQIRQAIFSDREILKEFSALLQERISEELRDAHDVNAIVHAYIGQHYALSLLRNFEEHNEELAHMLEVYSEAASRVGATISAIAIASDEFQKTFEDIYKGDHYGMFLERVKDLLERNMRVQIQDIIDLIPYSEGMELAPYFEKLVALDREERVDYGYMRTSYHEKKATVSIMHGYYNYLTGTNNEAVLEKLSFANDFRDATGETASSYSDMHVDYAERIYLRSHSINQTCSVVYQAMYANEAAHYHPEPMDPSYVLQYVLDIAKIIYISYLPEDIQLQAEYIETFYNGFAEFLEQAPGLEAEHRRKATLELFYDVISKYNAINESNIDRIRPETALSLLRLSIKLGIAHPTIDLLFENVWKGQNEFSRPEYVRSLMYDENKLRLARDQIEKHPDFKTNRKQIPAQTGTRTVVSELHDIINRQFPEAGGLKNKLLAYVEDELVCNSEETKLLSSSKSSVKEYKPSKEYGLVDKVYATDRAFENNVQRIRFVKYLTGLDTVVPNVRTNVQSLELPWGDSLLEHHGNYLSEEDIFEYAELKGKKKEPAGTELAGYIKRKFVQAEPVVRAYALQPLIVSIAENADTNEELTDMVLGKYAKNKAFRKFFTSYLRSVPHPTEARILLGHMLGSIASSTRTERSLSLHDVAEFMGPLFVKGVQILASGGLIEDRELSKEAEELFDKALKPERNEIFDKLHDVFGQYKIIVGELLGSGSINYVVHVKFYDPETQTWEDAAVRVTRDTAKGSVANEHKQLAATISDMRENETDQQTLRFADVLEEALSTSMRTLGKDGMEYDQSIETGNYERVKTVYAKSEPNPKTGFVTGVVEPLLKYHKLIKDRQKYSKTVAVFEYIPSTPLEEIKDARLRRELALQIVDAEREAVYEKGGFDTDPHKRNWLVDVQHKRIKRTDYAQFTSINTEPMRECVAAILEPRLSDKSIRVLALHSGDLFTITGADDVGNIETMIRDIVRRNDFPSYSELKERLWFLRRGLEAGLPSGSKVRFSENANIVLSSMLKTSGLRPYIGEVRDSINLLGKLKVNRAAYAGKVIMNDCSIMLRKVRNHTKTLLDPDAN